MDYEPSRRRYLALTGVSAIASLSGGIAVQIDSPNNEGGEFDIYALILDADQPSKAILDDIWDTYQFVYVDPATGERDKIAHDDSGWQQLATRLKPYSNTELPSSPPIGQLVFDEDRGTAAWWDRDHWEWPNFVDDVLTTPQTVANTTTRTVVWEPDINPDSLIKGRAYQIDLHGVFSTANTSDQFTVDVNLAGTDAAELQNVPANATDAPFSLETNFAIREDGTNGAIKPNTRGAFDDEAQSASHAEIPVDTTTVTNIAVAFQWDAADPDNTVTLEQAHFKQMG